MVSPSDQESERKVTDPLGQEEAEAVQRPPVGKDKGIRARSRTRKPTSKAASPTRIQPKRAVKMPIKAQQDTCPDSRLDEIEEQANKELRQVKSAKNARRTAGKPGLEVDADTKRIIKYLQEALAGAQSKGQEEQERVNSTLNAESTDAPVLHDESQPRGPGPRLTTIKARARGTISESTNAALLHDEPRPRGPSLTLTTIEAQARGTVGSETIILNADQTESRVVANMSEMQTCKAGLRSGIPKNDDKNAIVHEDSAEETLPECSFNKQEEIAW